MSSANRVGRVREDPRISVPKLGEYMDVRQANRRERIIRDQKYPSNFILTHYADAQKAIRAALLAGPDFDGPLGEKSKTIAARGPTMRHQIDAQRCSLDAIAAFRELWLTMPLDGVCRFVLGRMEFALFVENVSVSVFPTVMLQRTWPDGRSETGALLLVFRKEAALQEHGGEAAAEVLRRALARAKVPGVSRELCIVADVFAQEHFCAPKSNIRLMREVEAACREIAVVWPTVQSKAA